MDLILWRHADAEDGYGIADHERQLSAKGRKQAHRMAAWLAPQLPADTRILVSPATRTVQTAEALQRPFDTNELLFTSADFNDHLDAAGWPGATYDPHAPRTVLLVGHQPTLGQVAALLMSGRPEMWEVKKGAVWWLRTTPAGSEHQAKLRVMMAPGMLE